jgi:aromatic-L-amino-acid decarboxylase
MKGPSYPLEPSPDEMRGMIEKAAVRVIDHIASLPNQPAAYEEHDADSHVRAGALAESLPERGTEIDGLLDLLFEEAIPLSYNTAAPGYLAYIPGGGVFPSAVADLVANAVNRYVGVWIAAPGLAQLELNVVRWFCEIIGYPTGSGGILTTGGSLANFTAVVTARRERLPDDFLSGTIYTSDQAHHSVRKAAILAGFPAGNVRQIATDESYALRIDDLRRRLVEDRELGLSPFMLVASAGTTNTGAVDDLGGAADVAEAEGLWLHVDAAYGGFFMLTERGREAMRGIERADSVALDPHKGLFLPYGNGSLLVRDLGALRRAHSAFADYMPEMQHDTELVDFCQLSPELSRDFRGLRAWLPIKLFGIDAFRSSLDEKLDLAHWATDQLRGVSDVEIVAEPQLSLVAFRWAPAGYSEGGLNDLNRQLLLRVNGRRNVYMTGTTLRGQYALRICVLSFRTHRDRMEQCLVDVRESIAELSGVE